MQLSWSLWFFLLNILLLSCMGGSWAVSNHCCMLLCLIPYMHISNAYHSSGLCTERETAWIQLGWSIPFAACFREAGEDHECQSRRLEMFVRDAACSVADWGDQRGKMAGGKNWTLVKPFYLPSSPACTFVRFVSSFLYLKWDPTPPPPRLNFIREECQLSKYTRIIPSACMHTCITRLGYWISFGEKSILYHSFMDGDELTRRVQINWSPPAS